MYADFFNEYKRRRINNPTFISGHVLSSMMINPLKDSDQKNVKVVPRQLQLSRNHKIEVLNPEIKQRLGEQNKNVRKSLSNLSSYGSNSLKFTAGLSDKQVHYSQQKKYDIINLFPRSQSNLKIHKGENLIESQKKFQGSKIKENQIWKQNQNKNNDERRRSFDPNGYNGITTTDLTNKIQRLNRFKVRPFYLNNADEVYL